MEPSRPMVSSLKIKHGLWVKHYIRNPQVKSEKIVKHGNLKIWRDKSDQRLL